MRSLTATVMAIAAAACVVAVTHTAKAQDASPTSAVMATETAVGVSPSPFVTPDAEPATIPTQPSEPLPSTPGPPSPTPRLPEEGGPPGGVLGGNIYIDKDDSGSFTPGDTSPGGTLEVFRVYERQFDYETPGYDLLFTTYTNDSGYWEQRALPDGTYRVMWDAPLRDKANLARTIPPAEQVVINPLLTLTRVTRLVEVRNASRTLDIDMGMPDEGPVFGGGVQLPSTGTGGGGAGAPAVLLGVAGAGSLALAAAMALRRRRAA